MTRLRWLQYFVWIPVSVVLLGVAAMALQAQFIFSYEYVRIGQDPIYKGCTYFGRAGFVSTPAYVGRCPWLRFPIMGGG